MFNNLTTAISHHNIGISYYNSNNFDQALKEFKKAIEIRELIAPNSLDLANSYDYLGNSYYNTKQYEEAIDSYKKTIAIKELIAPNSLDLADSYNYLGNSYYNTEQYEEARAEYNKSLNIRKNLGPNTIGTDFAYHNIAMTYQAQGKNEEAIDNYKKAIEIREKISPNSLDLANSYNFLGQTYHNEKNFDEAIIAYHKANDIAQQSPNSMVLADCYKHTGISYFSLDKIDEATMYMEKSLNISKELEEGNTINHAGTYYHLGKCYRKSDPEKSLSLFEESYEMLKKAVGESHKFLSYPSSGIAAVALDLDLIDLASKYVDITIQQDPKFKISYLRKAKILHRQNDINQALEIIDTALKIDPGYADAKIYQLELLEEKTKQSQNQEVLQENISILSHELEEANNLPESEYDSQQKKESNFDVIKPEYNVLDEKYLKKLSELEDLVKKQQERLDQHEERLGTVENKVDILENRLDILDKKVYSLSHSMDIIKNALVKIDEKIKENSSNQEMLKELAQEREKIKQRESKIKEFVKNTDLREYYHCILSEIESAYIAAQAASSDKFKKEDVSGPHSQALEYLGTLASIIPVVGLLASKIIEGVGSLEDVYYNAKDTNELLKIKEISPSIQEFDMIALRIAVNLTIANQEQITSLEGAKIDRDWRKHLGAFFSPFIKEAISSQGDIIESSQGGLEGVINSFMKENDSKAKLLGRADGQEVIKYLQEQATGLSDILFYGDEERTSTSYKTRPSIVAEEVTEAFFRNRALRNQNIVNEVLNNDEIHVQNPLHKPAKKLEAVSIVKNLKQENENNKNDGCCVIS